MPTETNVQRNALCFMVKTWARRNTTETVLKNGWRLVAVGGWRLVNKKIMEVLKDSPGVKCGCKSGDRRLQRRLTGVWCWVCVEGLPCFAKRAWSRPVSEKGRGMTISLFPMAQFKNRSFATLSASGEAPEAAGLHF